jgi:hypothetical protein
MAYVNYTQKDDMQDQTYMVLTELIIDSIKAFREKDARTLHSDLDSIYLLVHNRMSREESEGVEETLREVDAILYGELGDDPEEILHSQCIIRLRELLKTLTRLLDEKGILLKMRADLDALVAGG